MKIALHPIEPGVRTLDVGEMPEEVSTLLKMWNDFYPQIGYEPPWIGYSIKLGETIVGSCSLIRNKETEEAEISYWTFEKYVGKGIASWACAELLTVAKRYNPGIKVIAKTEPRKNASTRILERNNFIFSEVVQDHEIGDAWKWRHHNP